MVLPLSPIAHPPLSPKANTPTLPLSLPSALHLSPLPQTVHTSLIPTCIAALQHRQRIIHPSHPSSLPPRETLGRPSLHMLSRTSATSIPHHIPILLAGSHFPLLLLQGPSSLHSQVSAQLALALSKDLLLYLISIVPNALTGTTTYLHPQVQSVHYHLHPMSPAQIRLKSTMTTVANCPLQVWSHLGRSCAA